MAKTETAEEKRTIKDLTGKQKAAILLMSLDVDVAAKVFQELEIKEVEMLAVEITNLRDLGPDSIDDVIEEFYQLMSAQSYMVEGGLEYAQVLLEKSYGHDRAKEIIEKIRVLTTIRGFNILKKSDPQQLASFLSKEHPQTIALIISHLPPDQSAEVLAEFKDDLKTETIIRIATIGKVSPQLVSEIEHVVDQIAEQTLSQNLAQAGGSQLVANILNKSNNAMAKLMLERIEEKKPDMAIEIKRLMFLFEDIILIDDKGIQRILRDVDKKDLAMALKVSDDKIRTKIFKNMSERASAVVKEELEYMGPVKLKDVESAQMRIVDIIKELEESEEISVGGRGKEDVFV
ncbi:MAG: flagellar motor switch protein FliG [Candidatus Kapabacteria bacterium]|nr:flagellar motor switch protein FliG [Ignavibacteriota bacterium]MCW5886042.1 flagellar motor switch protein FliG [Candidatus Kapabacteria bacterium]